MSQEEIGDLRPRPDADGVRCRTLRKCLGEPGSVLRLDARRVLMLKRGKQQKAFGNEREVASLLDDPALAKEN
jgi:hypothetical protein